MLSGGRYQLFTNDWIVLPEPDFFRLDMGRLTLAREISADYGFGGHQGEDFRIYVSPTPVGRAVPLDIRLGTDQALPFMGLEWDRGAQDDGAEIPEQGGSIFLPLVAVDPFRILLEVARTDAVVQNPDDALVAVMFDGMPITMAPAGDVESGVWLASQPMPATAAAPRIVELRITAARRAGGLRLRTVAIH